MDKNCLSCFWYCPNEIEGEIVTRCDLYDMYTSPDHTCEEQTDGSEYYEDYYL